LRWLLLLLVALAACRSGGADDPDGAPPAADGPPTPGADAPVLDGRHVAGPYRAYLGTLHDHHRGVNGGDDGGLEIGAPDEPGFTGSDEWWSWRLAHPENYEGGDAASAYARAAATGLDFFGLTPHNHLIDSQEYAAVVSAAAAATGVVGLPGQEWSSIESGNHGIVLDVGQRVTVGNGDWRALIEEWIPGYVAGHPDEDPFLVLAHPAIETSGYGPAEKAAFEYGLDDWPTRPSWAAGLSTKAKLVELISASENAENGLPRTFELWNDGVMVGLSVGPDNHRQLWGERSEARMGVLAESWTAGAIVEALRARRTYASEERDLGAHVAVVDGAEYVAWMGEEIAAPAGGSLELEVGLEDPTNPGNSYTIEILVDDAVGGAQVQVVFSDDALPAGTRRVSVASPPVGGMVVVHVRSSGGRDTWFSPVWVR
jgi:hypothetical protein